MCIEKQAEKIIWGEWCDYCGICGEEGFWYDDTEAMDQLEWTPKVGVFIIRTFHPDMHLETACP